MDDIRALQLRFKKLGKNIDIRLERLEKQVAKGALHPEVLKWGYAEAARMKENYGIDPGKRFERIPKLPTKKDGTIDMRYVMQLEKRVAEMENWLQKPSTTVTGLRKVYDKRLKTLKDRYGIDLTGVDVGKLFESKGFEKMSNLFGSKVALSNIATLRESKADIMEAVKAHKYQHLQLDSNSAINNELVALLKDKKNTKWFKELVGI